MNLKFIHMPGASREGALPSRYLTSAIASVCALLRGLFSVSVILILVFLQGLLIPDFGMIIDRGMKIRSFTLSYMVIQNSLFVLNLSPFVVFIDVDVNSSAHVGIAPPSR